MKRLVFSSFITLYCSYLFVSVDGCGSSGLLSGRIIGGSDAEPGQIPFQALIIETKVGVLTYRKCGGVILDHQWILTAAHCRQGWFGRLRVVVGQSEMASNRGKVIRDVIEVVPHPYYSQQNHLNDIMLLKLNESLEFTDNIQPICLPDSDNDFSHMMATVSGWGTTRPRKIFSFLNSLFDLTHHIYIESSRHPERLQYTEVPIMTNEECETMFNSTRYRRVIHDSMLCAGYAEGGKDSCSGDSGGPLMIRNYDGRWVLVGIVSHGVGCAEPNLPGVYTNVASYVDWIDSKIQEHESFFKLGRLLRSRLQIKDLI